MFNDIPAQNINRLLGVTEYSIFYILVAWMLPLKTIKDKACNIL